MKTLTNTIVIFLILLVTLFLILRYQNIDINELFTNVSNKNLTIISSSIAIIIILSYCLTCETENFDTYKTVLAQNDIKPNNYVMSFEQFYKTFIMKEENTYMIFSTTINDIKYYMIMHSSNENNLPYRKLNIDQNPLYADKPFLCGDTTFVYPVLIREDLLNREYREFVDDKFKSVNLDFATKKALYKVKKENPDLFIENFSLSSLNPINLFKSSDSEYDQIKKNVVYPRFIHHFYVQQTVPSIESKNISLLDVMNSPVVENNNTSELVYESIETGIQEHIMEEEIGNVTIENFNTNLLNKKTQTKQKCYIISGETREQVKNGDKTNPYILDLSKNFNPYTIHRKQEILTKNGELKREQIDIINDNKFVCGIRQIGALTKYSNFYAVTKTPQLEQLDKHRNNKLISEESKLNDKYVFEGRDNMNVSHLDPFVNLYVLGDFKNANNVPFDNVKCWLARLDTYDDPDNIDNDKSSKYYGSYKMYPIGIVPDDYNQCQTIDNKIDTYCRGTKYINGVDYSDARKIDFELSTVKLNMI